MRVLLTNDDGIQAEGLRTLAAHIAAWNRGIELWIVAPESERSAVSHGKTIRGPIRVRALGGNEYSCSGTPVDCVLAAVLELMGGTCDLVVSGINKGPNLGFDILYSGTCGAARQASMMGIPALAVSCASESEDIDYRGVAAFVSKNLERLRTYTERGAFININGPSSPSEGLAGLWARPGGFRYKNHFEIQGGSDWFLKETPPEQSHGRDSDFTAVQRDFVALSLIAAAPHPAHDCALNGTVFS